MSVLPSDLSRLVAPEAYYFDGGRFEPRSGRLVHRGVEVRLRPKTAGVLSCLLERSGDLVSKSELVDRVWGRAVGDASLAVCITELRRLLGDEPRQPRLIGTAHRRGYRFLVGVSTGPASTHDRVAVVGRDAELDVLRAWSAASAAGQRTTGFVAGEAGSGRTTLLQTFLDETRSASGVVVGEGRCSQRHASEPYLPFLDVLASLARGAHGMRFRELLQQLAPTWAARLPAAVRPERSALVRSSSGERPPEHLWYEAAQALDAFAQIARVVVVLDDLHAGDPATLRLFAYLAERPGSARMLLLASYRSDAFGGAAPWAWDDGVGVFHRSGHLELPPLGAAAVREMLARRLGAAGSDPRTVSRILERSGGNALIAAAFVELVAEGADRGAGRPSESSGAVARTEDEIPAGAHRLVGEWIARFTSADREVLLAAAAVGVEFTSDDAAAAIAAMAGAFDGLDGPDGRARGDERGVERRLRRIANASGVLVEIEPTVAADGAVTARFRFRHAVVREVLHARLGIAERVIVTRALRALAGHAPVVRHPAPHLPAHPAGVEHAETAHRSALGAMQLARAAAEMRGHPDPADPLEVVARGARTTPRAGAPVEGSGRWPPGATA